MSQDNDISNFLKRIKGKGGPLTFQQLLTKRVAENHLEDPPARVAAILERVRQIDMDIQTHDITR